MKRIDQIPDELYASLCNPTNPTKGREITPSSDLFNTAPSGGGVWGGTGLQVLGVEWRVAATCWVRQYRVFTNATLPSRHEDQGGGYIFAIPRGNPCSKSLLSSSGLLTQKYVQIFAPRRSYIIFYPWTFTTNRQVKLQGSVFQSRTRESFNFRPWELLSTNPRFGEVPFEY